MDQTPTHQTVAGSNSMPSLQACPPMGIESNATSNLASTKKRRPIQPRSEVWPHFKRKVENGEVKGICRYCSKIFHADTKRNGKTSLKNHLETCTKSI